MKYIYTLAILLTTNYTLLCGQDEAKDSIYINKLIDSANIYIDNDIDLAQQFATHSIDYSQSLNFIEGVGYGNYVLSRILTQKGNYKSADSLLDLSINIFSKPLDESYLSMCFSQKGYIRILRFELDSAEHFIQKAMDLDLRTNDEDGLSYNYNNLGTIEDYRGNYERALILFQKGLKIFEKLDNKEMASNAYNNISILHYHLKRYKDAIEAQKKAITLNIEIKNLYNLSMNYVCISAYYLQVDSITESEIYANKALEQCNILEFTRGKLYSLAALGDVELKKGNPKKALDFFNEFEYNFPSDGDPYMKAEITSKIGFANRELGNLKTSITYFNDALNQFESFETVQNIMDTHQQLSEVYALNNNYKKAYEHFASRDSIKTEYFNTEKQKQIREIEAKYETEKKEVINKQLMAEQELAKSKVSRQKDYLIGTGIGLAIFSILSFLLFRQSNKRKLLNKVLSNKKDRINLLNKELNHRVKNNLAFITSLLEMQSRRSETEETKLVLEESKNRLKALSLVHENLFRKEDDIDINLKLYLEELVGHLQNIFKTPGKPIVFKTSFIEHISDAEDAIRIGLIINELVTNSVKHAFPNIDHPIISIETTTGKNGKVSINYADNGPGITENKDNNPDDTSSSMGSKLISLLAKQMEGSITLKIA